MKSIYLLIILIIVFNLLISVAECRKNKKQGGGGKKKGGGGGGHQGNKGGGGGGNKYRNKKKHFGGAGGGGGGKNKQKKQKDSDSDYEEYSGSGINFFDMFRGGNDVEIYEESGSDYDYKPNHKKNKNKQKQQQNRQTWTTEKTPSRQTTFETTTPMKSTKDYSMELYERGMKQIEKLKQENQYELNKHGLTTRVDFWEDWDATHEPIPLQYLNITKNYSHLYWNNKMSNGTLYQSCPTRFRELYFGTRSPKNNQDKGDPIFLHFPQNNIHYLKPHEYEINHFENYQEVLDFLELYHPNKSVEFNVTYDGNQEYYIDYDNHPHPDMINRTTNGRGRTTSRTTKATRKPSAHKTTVDSSEELFSFHKNPYHSYTDEWYDRIYSTEESNPSYPNSNYRTSAVWKKIRMTRSTTLIYREYKDKLRKDKKAFEKQKKAKKKAQREQKQKSNDDYETFMDLIKDKKKFN